MPSPHFYIGCSGFHYKEWKGVFYPERMASTQWFEYYCRHFNTLELNMSFYRFPTIGMLREWYERSPDNFVFSVKAPRLITHYKKFEGAADLLEDFYGAIGEGLRNKLGFVLFQLPAQVPYSEAFLQKITGSLSPAFANTVEFRHDSWWRPDVYEWLGRHRISFCGISHPQLPDTVIINTTAVYYRFHGVPLLYYSPCSDVQLQTVAASILQEPRVQSAYIYFNNTAGTEALADARKMMALLH